MAVLEEVGEGPGAIGRPESPSIHLQNRFTNESTGTEGTGGLVDGGVSKTLRRYVFSPSWTQ